MGIYLNPGNKKFNEVINTELYVDKSMLISETNKLMDTMKKYICISRPRRFGKSIAANMLTAYYSRGCDSRDLFQGLKIAEADSFEKHMNQYDVVFLNMQEFLSRSRSTDELIERIKKLVLRDLLKAFPDVDYFDTTDLIQCMQEIYAEYGNSFIFIIDEWDCVFREYKNDKEAQRIYLDFLRDMLKDKDFIALNYFNNHSLKQLENIALSEDTGKALQRIVREYAAYHLDASNIKSETMI